MTNTDSLRIYIVEDQAVSRAMLEDLLSDNGYRVIGSSSKAETAWEDIQQLEVDLILLDIHLAGLRNGIWLAQKIRAELDHPFIYLTAYGDSKTLKEVVATYPNGYLMKPYNLPTLITTIIIAIENFSSSRSVTNDRPNIDHGIAVKDYIFIKDGQTLVKLFVKNIIYIQSDGNYIHIYQDQKKYTIRSKLANFHAQLPPELFIYLHLRYVVNVEMVTKLDTDKVYIDDLEIPVSKTYRHNLSFIVARL